MTTKTNRRKTLYVISLLLTIVFLWTGCQKESDPTVEKFTVSFNSDGGSAVTPVEVNKGDKITKPSNPTKGTLIFVDWYKEAAGTTPWNFDVDVVTANITLYAKWTTVEYTVTFNTNGGSSLDAVKVAEGATLPQLVPPSKAGFIFDKWYTDAGLTTVYDLSARVTANLTLYAKWNVITGEMLDSLVQEAERIVGSNYTSASYAAMYAKRDAASQVLANTNATSAQIITAYNELRAAITALVALPVRAVASIEIGDGAIVDGYIYVTPNTLFFLSAILYDAHGYRATDSRVTFTYSQALLDSWVDGDISTFISSILFSTQSTLAVGQTVTITITSVANPSVSKIVTLKVAAPGELKDRFIAAVNALPQPSAITYEDYDNLQKAYSLYYSLSNSEKSEANVEQVYLLLDACRQAFNDLPEKLTYSFNGSACIFRTIEGDITETDFVANGAFPQGTYTMQWEYYDGDGLYYQSRVVFKANGQGGIEARTATDTNGAGASAWEEAGSFTYTYTGSKSAGGIFYLTFTSEDDSYTSTQQANMSLAKSVNNVTKSTHRIFKR